MVVVFFGKIDVLLVIYDVRFECLIKEVTFLYFNFYYWLFILKFELNLYRVLARARQAFH